MRWLARVFQQIENDGDGVLVWKLRRSYLRGVEVENLNVFDDAMLVVEYSNERCTCLVQVAGICSFFSGPPREGRDGGRRGWSGESFSGCGETGWMIIKIISKIQGWFVNFSTYLKH